MHGSSSNSSHPRRRIAGCSGCSHGGCARALLATLFLLLGFSAPLSGTLGGALGGTKIGPQPAEGAAGSRLLPPLAAAAQVAGSAAAALHPGRRRVGRPAALRGAARRLAQQPSTEKTPLHPYTEIYEKYKADLEAVRTGKGAGPAIGGSKSRVAIVMGNTIGDDHTGEMAHMINLLYTHKHGYDMIVERNPPNSESMRFASTDKNGIGFARPLMLMKALVHYDYAVYMDSDAYVHDFAQTVESFFEQSVAPNASLAIGADCLWHDACWTADLNTGVIFARRGAETTRLLEAWALAPAPGNFCDADRETDQGCLNQLLRREPWAKALVQLLAPGEPHFNASSTTKFTINSHAGAFVTHYVSCYGGCRRDKLFHALRFALHAHLALDLQPAWPDLRTCAFIVQFQFFVEELERRPLFTQVVTFADGTQSVARDDIIRARGAAEGLATLLGCGIEAGRRKAPPGPEATAVPAGHRHNHH